MPLDFYLPVVITALAFLVGGLFIAAGLLQWLWNITMPEAFGLRAIRYWIAFRLILVASLLGAPAIIHAK